MDQMRRATEHPPSENLDPSRYELEDIEDLAPEAREADAVKGGDGGIDIDLRKSGASSSTNTGRSALVFRFG
jgi:hypothetical protein